jgi:hypothetical protein
MTGPVTVTQADREGWREMKPIAEMVQAEFDAAIARARIEGAKMALEAAAKVAADAHGCWTDAGSPLGLATAIRQIDPAALGAE